MTFYLPSRISILVLGIAILGPLDTSAQPKSPPFPSKAELRSLQLLAYACSRENTIDSCARTRERADPLMDHPRLPAACKDTVWELLQEAKPAISNSFKRRDRIDSPARRITVVCADPVKPKPEKKLPPGAPGANQT